MKEMNTKIIKFKKNTDKYGNLVPIEECDTFPFSIRRVYYIYSVDEGVRRGFHSHKELNQMLICVSGSVNILLKTPFEEKIVTLDKPDEGLYIGPMIWREMYDFSEDAVLLVLADKHYNECDYIRKYENYEKMAIEYFKTKEN